MYVSPLLLGLCTNCKPASLEDLGEGGASAASDFIKQYTTRQAYRHTDPASEHSEERLKSMHIGLRAQLTSECEETLAVLDNIQSHASSKKFVPFSEQRNILQRAAALLCRTEKVVNYHAEYFKDIL